ncbi:SH3 and multiple ankyrin repeat domains protein 2-like isoform X5 [Eriocheir sinensis]|uniref:SH3 and multiple ankyrin repeat domains protein 2-like isoform X5 n=1 Tax=Eriocheir sinensis TaxID=95602 RepID=UPI0021C8E2CD|nr:SH3 and multiple ankyrin repeat domains protein 2-like isoform X5 [Eriocheir sinensis]
MPSTTSSVDRFHHYKRPGSRRSRVNYNYKYRRASCPLAFEENSPRRLLRSRSAVIMEDGVSLSSASGSASGAGGSSSASSMAGEEVVLRINVPELKVEKCLQFHRDDLVWDVKQQALAALPKVALWYRELRESFNYGLFCPPQNGRAGKFLDEERPLGDYPLLTPVGYLELKYKRRVYKMLHLEEKALRALHTRANLRRFLEYVKENNVDKVSKMCAKGMDPNFHCQETGETPLTLAARIKKPARMIVAMVNGGALLDYRTRDGVTAMHRAVQASNFEAVKTLLDLGASPNYRDTRGLTPLYYSVTHNTDPLLCEALLHDYAVIGASDSQGWQETHQACRNKMVQHLEHLLFYGADMNAQNASGNTPLHVCAVNNLEDCARVLLFRGCNKNAINYANQTPYQVAVIAGNMDLGEVIKTHNEDDVVPFKEPPKYNPNRRISGVPLSRTHSDPRLEVSTTTKPPSPSPSTRSIPPFSSASSLSETSTGSSSTCTHPSEMDSEECASALGSASLNAAGMDCCDMVSDSSGVCTSNSGSAESYDATPTDVTQFDMGMLVVCLQQYILHKPGHLDINAGDILEVTGSTDDGMLEGVLRGVTGVFPPHCVQEVRLRNPQAVRESLIAPQVARVQGRREMMVPPHYGTAPRIRKPVNEPRTVVLHRGKKGFGFVLRGAKATSPLMERPHERGPALQYLDDVDPGGVADLAGLKKGDYLIKINGEDVSQASHEHVVTLIRKSGDLVQMVVVTPSPMTSFTALKPPMGNIGTIRLRSSQAPPAPPPRDPRTTLSVGRARAKSMVAGLQDIEALDASMRENGDVMSRSAGEHYGVGLYGSPQGTPSMGTPVGTPPGPKVASIKARPSSKRMTAAEVEDLFQHSSSPPTSPSSRPPRVYASVAEMKKAKMTPRRCKYAFMLRFRASSESPHSDMAVRQSTNKSSSSQNNTHCPPGLRLCFPAMNFIAAAGTAMKARHVAELTRMHKVFRSTPDLKAGVTAPLPAATAEEKRKSISQEDLFISTLNGQGSRHSLACPPRRSSTLGRSPVGGGSLGSSQSWQSGEDDEDDDEEEEESSDSPNCSPGPVEYRMLRRSQSAVNAAMLRRAGLHPPPTHPPPPPPLGQLVKVDISRSKSDYATVGVAPSTPDSAPLSPAIQSSFRPTDSAKLYASPEEVKAVGYRSPDSAGRKGTSVKTRSQSLPPSTSRPSVQRGSPERAAQAAYSATAYSTFRGEGREGSRSQEPLSPPATAPHRPPVSDSVTYARPKNNRSVQENVETNSPSRVVPQGGRGAPPPSTPAPDIPEPDYSSDENSSAPSLSQDDSKKTKTLKKKKQSVAFSPNLVTSTDPPTPPQQDSDGPHYAAPSRTPAPALAPVGPLGGNNFRDMIAQKAAERQARQDDGPEGSRSANSSPAKRINNGNGNGALGDAIQESALFNRQREKSSPAPQVGRPVSGPNEDLKMGRIMRNSKSCPNEFLEDGDNSSSGVSSDQDPAEAYVTVINTESDTISATTSGNGGSERFLSHQGSRDDSSEASESSDEASDRTWILTNERSGERSDSRSDSDSNGARRSGSLTRNAVSLVKLPPPQETTEPDLEGETARQGDQDTLSTVSSLSSLSSGSGGSGGERERAHPPLTQAQHSLPTTTHPHMRATLPRTPSAVTRAASAPPQTTHGMKTVAGGSLTRGRPREQLWSSEGEGGGMVREKSAPPASRTLERPYKGTMNSRGAEYERSIEESLQLIRMHMDSLNEVNTLAGVPGAGGGSEMVLAPPPEFCDLSLSEHHPRRNKTVIHISSDTQDPPVSLVSGPSRHHHHHHHHLHHHHQQQQQQPQQQQHPQQQHPQQQHQHQLQQQQLQQQQLQQHQLQQHQLQQQQLQQHQLQQHQLQQHQLQQHQIQQHQLQQQLQQQQLQQQLQQQQQQEQEDDTPQFRHKTLTEWTTRDTTEWLESIFMPEYKDSFEEQDIDGRKLMGLNNDALINLGVRRVGHRVSMEKSLKRYKPTERIDL